MNATQRELFRIEILRTTANCAPQAATLRVLHTYLRPVFLKTTEAEIEVEVQYLVGKGLLTPAAKTLSPENKAWHVSADGRDFLAEQGLE